MATKTRTKLMGTLTTLTITSILLWIAFNQNFTLNASGDITCAGTAYYNDLFKDYISDCQVFWNVTSINYTYYFKNKEGINLIFSPEVNDWKWYAKDGRYNSGWRPLDKSGNFTFRKGIKYQFMAFVFKEPEQTIKWTIISADVTKDPILFGILFTTLKDCKTTTETRTMQIYDTEIIFNYNQTICSDFPTNKSCKQIALGNSTRKLSVGSYNEFINTTTCEDIGFNVSRKIINYNKVNGKCTIKNCVITCDYFQGGNKNGVINSGESYDTFDICNNLKHQSRKDVGSLRQIEIKT